MRTKLISGTDLGGLPQRLRAAQLMVRQEHTGLELPFEALASAAEGLLRGLEEFLAVPRVGLRTAAHNDDVPRGALGGLDGAKSILVATP